MVVMFSVSGTEVGEMRANDDGNRSRCTGCLSFSLWNSPYIPLHTFAADGQFLLGGVLVLWPCVREGIGFARFMH